METWTFIKFLPAYRCLLFGLLYLYWSNVATGQNLQEQDGVCNAEGCYSIHLQRKTFRESWRICKDKGGNLATVKRPEEASLIHELLSSGVRRASRPRIRLWIGLQRQPRQCSASRPLRGFTWITGDQETQYTNWQRDDISNACAAHRCVVITYNTADRSGSDQNNFKWLDGSCTVAVDGFLCRYSYQGMCPALQKEGGGPALYTTPFHLVSTVLTHIPFGTVATVPCPDGEKEDQSVLCMLREDGSVGWSKDAPLCTDTVSKDWCEHENTGCAHYCVNTDKNYFCECSENYELGEDGKSCQLIDPCQTANCEFECEVTPQGQRCKCPEGYLLSDDGQNCLDIDECLQEPCPQVCVNALGTYECLCNEGYLPTEFGECLDVDECMEGKCDHLCENLPGSYVCRCHEGFSSNAEDPDQCEDADECEIPNICDQICRNFEGGFECLCEDGYLLQEDRYYCRPSEDGVEHLTTVLADATLNEPSELVTDASPPEWFTESPSIDWVPTYLTWFAEYAEQERDMTTQEADLSEQASSKSHSSHIWMDTTTSAHADSHDEDAKLWLNEEEIYPNGDTADARTFEDNRLIASTPITTNRDFVVLTPAASQTPEGTLASASGTEPQKKHDKSWLLVALLVPLCIFIVVMLALGIVYCTSCAVEPRNKSVTDCYRWTTTSKPEKPNTAKSRP